MHRRTVIVDHDIALVPVVDVDELRPGCRLVQVGQEDPRFRHRPADNGAGMGGKVKRLSPRRREAADQALADRSEVGALCLAQLGKAEPAAGMEQRVLADQAVDLGFGVVVEGIVGGGHVGEFGLAAARRGDSGREQRKLRRNRPERTNW